MAQTHDINSSIRGVCATGGTPNRTWNATQFVASLKRHDPAKIRVYEFCMVLPRLVLSKHDWDT